MKRFLTGKPDKLEQEAKEPQASEERLGLWYQQIGKRCRQIATPFHRLCLAWSHHSRVVAAILTVSPGSGPEISVY